MPLDDLTKLASAFGVKTETKPAPTDSGSGFWTPERVKQATEYLQQKAGLSPIGAHGLVSRWAGVEAQAGPNSVNPTSGAYGIAQWLGPRKNGVPADFEGQLAHAARELNSTESAAAKRLRMASTPQDAAIGAAMYERAKGFDKNNPGAGDNFVQPTIRTMNRLGVPASAPAPVPDNSLNGLASAFGAPTTSDLGSLEASLAPTGPADVPAADTSSQNGTAPDEAYMRDAGLIADTPEERKAALLANRQRASDELKRAKTPARRNILLERMKKIDSDLLSLDQEIRANAAKPAQTDGQGRNSFVPVGAGPHAGYNDTSEPEAPTTTTTEANPDYADFLKQTGLSDNQASIDEFNLAQKTSAEGANAQNQKDTASHNAAVADYNAKLQQGKPAKQPSKPAQPQPQAPARDDTRHSKYEINLNEKRPDQSYTDYHNEYVANQLANELGVNYDTARAVVDRFPLRFADKSGGDVTEEYLKAQAEARTPGTVTIGDDVKKSIKDLDAKIKAKNTVYDKERSSLTDTPDVSPAELDLTAEMRAAAASGPDSADQVKGLQASIDKEHTAYTDWLSKTGFSDEAYRQAHSMEFDRERGNVVNAYGSFTNLQKRVDDSKGKYDYRPLAEPLSYLGVGSDDYEADEAAKGAYEARHRLADEDIKNSVDLGTAIKTNPFFSPESEFMKSAGSSFVSGLADFAAGANKYDPFSALSRAVYQAVSGEEDTSSEKLNDFAQKIRFFNEASTKDGLIFQVPHIAGDVAGSAPKIIGLTMLTGDPMIAFGLDAFLSSSNKPLKEQFQQTAKNVILGAAFNVISPFAKFVGSKAAARYLSPEIVEALDNPDAQKSFADTIKAKGLKILALAEEGAPGEKENAQRALDAFLKKNNFKLSDLTSESPTYSPEVQSALRRAMAAKFVAERGTSVGLVGGVGYGTARLEGQNQEQSVKSGLLFAVQDFVFGVLGKKDGEGLTPEDIVNASEHVVTVPDPATNKPRDIMLLADEEGLHAVDVTGQVPPDAIDAEILPKAPKPKPVSPTETVKPGEAVEIADKGEGVVVEDRGKNVVVDTNPKVDKKGETKYQGRSVVPKKDLTRPAEDLLSNKETEQTPASDAQTTSADGLQLNEPTRPAKPIRVQGIQLAPREPVAGIPTTDEGQNNAQAPEESTAITAETPKAEPKSSSIADLVRKRLEAEQAKAAQESTAKTDETPSEQKEPWQMTKAEFESALTARKTGPNVTKYHLGEHYDPNKDTLWGSQEAAMSNHRYDVREALGKGKPVPANVLADYPDLAKTPEAKPETVEPEFYHDGRPAIELSKSGGQVKIQYLDGKKETPTVSRKELTADKPVAKPDFAGTVNMDAVTPENIDQIAAMFDKKPAADIKEHAELAAKAVAPLGLPDGLASRVIHRLATDALRDDKPVGDALPDVVRREIVSDLDGYRRHDLRDVLRPFIDRIKADGFDVLKEGGKVWSEAHDAIKRSDDLHEGKTEKPAAPSPSIADLVRKRLEAEQAKTAKDAAKNESLSLLNDAFDLGLDTGNEPDTLKAVLPKEFDEAKYESKVKPGLEKAMEAFAGKTPQESVDALIDHLLGAKVPLEKIVEMEPYIVRFLEDKNTLQSPEKGSIPKPEAQNEPDATKPDRDGKDGNEVEGPADVSGTGKGGQTGSGSSGKSGSGTGDVSPDATPGDGSDGNIEKPGSKTDAESVSTGKPGAAGSDSPGNRIPKRGASRDYIAPVGSLTREGSWKAAAENNLNAIQLAKKIEAEKRDATPEEQAQLAKFVGWGASEIKNNIFKDPDGYSIKSDWKDLARRLQTELTPEELKTAERSTQYAHYTSEKVIRGIWSALEQFGFNKGSIMEPGMGIGLFAVAAPKNVIENSSYTGIEMDAMTARIAKLLLPDQAALENDFTKQKLPENHFDIAIGNPPFSGTHILADPKYKKYRFLLHDYFFAKSLDSVRPGGLLVFVTSKGTMDKMGDAAREYMSKQADLLGAIRLPQTAFKQNAGTDVVTDVLFFRKRMAGEEPGGEKWLGHAEVTADNKYGTSHTGLVNEYFVNHPEMVLGEHSFAGEMRHGDNEYTVLPKDGDIEDQFLEAVKNLPKAVFAKQGKTAEIVQASAERDWSPTANKEGSLYIHDDGRLMLREGGSGVQLAAIKTISPREDKWLKDYVGLRTALKQAQYDQLNAEKEGADWEKSLADLNKSYDAFVKKHGNILDFTDRERTKTDDEGNEITTVTRSFKNEKLLSNDVESPLVWTLEKITDDGDIIKSDWLKNRVIKPPEPPKIENLQDALMVSLDTTGRLNIGHIAELMRPLRTMNEPQVIDELGDLIYEEPGGGYVMADEYLSGNVKDKLEIAEAAASDPRFVRNVEALQKVQPLPLPPEKITVQIGATWVPVEHVSKFAEEVLGIKGPRDPRSYGRQPAVEFDPITNKWTVPGAHGSGSQSQRSATKEWGTEYRSPEEVLEAALNSETVTIMSTDPGPPRRTYVNKEAVAGVRSKMEKMDQAFKPWLFSEPERSKELTDLYNRKMNVMAEREFNGEHLTTPGLSIKYTLYPHQKRVIWRVIQTGNTYLAHAVGAGKTLEMIVSAMEQKRLGLISKPMFIVPNHMLKQFSSEFLDAYPLANIMVADEQNFHTDNRKRFVAQAALNDLDAVVLTHSAFGLLRNTEESSRIVLDDMLEEMRDAMDALTTGQDRHGNPIGANLQDTSTISRIQARIESIEQKFYGRMGMGRDNVLDFEELGVDFLYVDEAHEFRKLDFVTNQTNLKGIDPSGSMRALDLLVKARWLDRHRPNRSLVLASGTPITNTMAELYSIQRFLGHRELIEDGLDHFDAWARQFGQVEEKIEANAAGGYKPVKRFRKIVNTGVLMQRVRKFMDVLTLTQLGDLVKLPTIKLNSEGKHAADVIVTEPYPELEEYLKGELSRRIEASEKWKPSFQEKYNPDPMIAIIGDGQLAAFDMRFIHPDLPSNPASKLNRMIDGILDAYHKDNEIEYFNRETGAPYPIKGAAHIVFSYGGFGDQVAANRHFSAKNWLRKRLVEGGIPNAEIAFISDYKSSSAKQSLFKEIREGKKKVLVGSPKNMGTGVNAQLRLKTLHYGMAPWYPSDIEQPHGRIVRQGNQNDEVDLNWYAAKGTYDETQWGMLAGKGKMIEDAMSGNYDGDVEDVSESSQYAMASALSSGDPRALRYAELQGIVEKYTRLEHAYHSSAHRLASELSSLNSSWSGVPKVEKDIASLDAAIKLVPDHVDKENFSIQIGNETFNKDSDKNNSEIGNALKAAWFKAARENKKKAIDSKKEIHYELAKVLGNLRVFGSAYVGHNDEVKNQIAITIGDITTRLADKPVAEGEIVDISESGLISRTYNAINGLQERKEVAERELASKIEERKQVEAAIARPFEFSKDLSDARTELYTLGNEMAGLGIAKPPVSMTAEQIKDVLDAFNMGRARKAMSETLAHHRGQLPKDRKDQPVKPFTLEPSGNQEAIHPLNSEPGTLKSVAGEPNAPIFYSQVERTIENKMPNRASAAQIRGILKDTKQEERDWLGIDQFLADNPNPTKAEVLDFVRSNNVDVQEVLKGTKVNDPGEFHVGGDDDDGWYIYRKVESGFGGSVAESERFYSREDAEAALPDFVDETPTRGDTKFSGYTLPGAEPGSYRELLLTMPENQLPTDLNIVRQGVYKDPKGQDMLIGGNGVFTAAAVDTDGVVRAVTATDGNIEEALARNYNNNKGVSNYTSRHWDEPNVLAHVRFDDRDGGKTLHIAELQSDWGQAGREKGYKGPALTEDENLRHRRLSEKMADPGSATAADEAEYHRLQEKKAASNAKIPAMPFPKSWPELAMKRMIRYAAENGYDRLTFDTGETQNDRYDLSKQIDSVKWKKVSSDGYKVEIYKDGQDITQQIGHPDVLSAAKLPDYLGKDVAERITGSSESKGTLEGDGLKVGGSGMKGFYDKILPSFVSRYVKKWGGKVEPANLDIVTPKRSGNIWTDARIEENKSGEFELYARKVDGVEETYLETFDSRAAAEEQAATVTGKSHAVPVHSLTITPEMRYSVMKEGQRLFKVLDEEKMSNADKLTYEQMKALPYQPFDDLLNDAEATRFGNLIKANAYSHEIYRRTFEEARIRQGKARLGGKDSEDLFAGVFLKPDAVADTVDILNEKAEEAKGYGYTADEVNTLHDLAAMLKNAAEEGKGTAVVYVFDKALPEELFHNADYLGAAEKSLLNRHTDEYKAKLDTHPVVEKLWTKHFSRYNEYTRIKNNKVLKAVLRAEIAPFLLELSDKDLAFYGITPEQRNDYLLKWFQGYAAKNGIDSLDYFDRDEIDVHTFIDQIKSAAENQNGALRQKDEGHSQGPDLDGEAEERAGPGRGRSDPAGRIDPVAYGADASEFLNLEKGQKFASLPRTLRKAGLDADEVVYQVFGDKPAQEEANRMLEENGIAGSIKLLRNISADAQDVSHAILSFMLQRALLDHAVNIQNIDPQAAQESRELARKLGREHAMKAVGAGRFTRAASIVSHSLEHLVYTVNEVVTDKYGEDKTLSPEEWERIEAVGREAEEAFARITALEKEKLWLQRKIKRMETEREGRGKRRRSSGSRKARQKLVDLVKDKNSARVEEIKRQLIAQFGEPGTAKSVASVTSTEPLTLKAILDTGEFDDETLDQFAEVGAMMLTEGLSGPDDYLPEDFHADMLATFGDAIGSNFQEIYTRSWNKREEWLNQVRADQKKERLENKIGEDLEDWEVEEILGEQKDKAKRRRAIESIHRMMAKGKKESRNLKDYKRLISLFADSDDAAIAGILLSQNANVNEIYQRLSDMGITEPAKQREAIRRGQEALDKAKLELRIENDAIANEIMDQTKAMQQIDDLRWTARQDSTAAQQAIAGELRRIKNGEFWYRTGQVMDIGNAMRTLMASMDMSGTLRQGGYFTFATPEKQGEALVAQFKSLGEIGYGRAIQAVENHPNFALAQRSGVAFAVAGKREDQFGEEIFRGEDTIEKVPILGPLVGKLIVKPSERTYTSFLDTQRMVMFDVFAKELMAAGMNYQRNKNEFNKIGEFVSVATGRGKVPANMFGKILMTLPLFAPRYTLSRFQLLNMTLNPVAYYNLPPAARKVVMRSAVRFYGTMALLMGIAAGLGLTTLDDDDSDFLKIKIGNTRYDIFAGALQPAKMIIKIIHAAIRGDRIPREMSDEMINAVTRFIRGKLSPLGSLLADWGTGSDYVGNEFTWGKAIYSRLMPLTIGDAMDAYQLDGTVGIAKSVPATWFGVGVSTYATNPEKPTTEAEKLAAKAAAAPMKDKPSTQPKATRDLVQKLTARSRVGDPTVEAEIDALPPGTISDDQKRNILAARTKSYLEDKAEGLSLHDIEAVFKVATPEERTRLLPLIDKKMKNAYVDNKLSAEDRARLEKLGAHIVGDVPMPDDIKKEFDKLKLPIPDVGESLTPKKGAGKQKLTPDQYEQYRKGALQDIYGRVGTVIASDAYKEADDAKKEHMLTRAVGQGRSREQKDMKKELRQP